MKCHFPDAHTEVFEDNTFVISQIYLHLSFSSVSHSWIWLCTPAKGSLCPCEESYDFSLTFLCQFDYVSDVISTSWHSDIRHVCDE